ncbi:MAG: hypothetical protein HY913_20145 [Desulfomonile tiedjei]|nr:hypothetical protein [Desulfomonile tiedjei]
MKREMGFLVLIYFAAHLPILVTTGNFYDDWVYFHPDPTVTMKAWSNVGKPLAGLFLNFLQDAGGSFAARLCTFLTYLGAALLLYGILTQIHEIDPEVRFCLVSIFMVFPADTTRVLSMLSFDSACYFLCFLGFWLLSRYLISRCITLRVAALLAFFVSFWVNSLLVFYALVFAYIWYQERGMLRSSREWLSLPLRYADFIALPLVFWVVQRIWFPAAIAGYNELEWGFLSPRLWAYFIREGLVKPVVFSVVPLNPLQVIGILTGTTVLYWLWPRGTAQGPEKGRVAALLMVIGILCLVLAMLPYLAVGKASTYEDWGSRHGRLLPLGAGFVICGIIWQLSSLVKLNSAFRVLLASLVLSVFVSASFKVYMEYWRDWYKQLSLVRVLKASDTIKDHTSFLFSDQAQQWNVKKRILRYYDYTALMNLAFNDERRFGIDERTKDWQSQAESLCRELRGPKSGDEIYLAKAVRLTHWVPKMPEYKVTILPIIPELSASSLFRLKFREIFDKSRFGETLPQIVRLEFKRLQL